MLRGAGAGAEVSTKTGGSDMVLAREGAGGCGSGVVRGRSPIFARYLFTAVRAALVIVSTSWCVVGVEKSSFRVVGGHDTCISNAGVCVGSERGGTSRCTVLVRAIRGGNGGLEPSFVSGA